ncbi:MAG: tol-pal system protein YbgF [Paracoccaceae bacterium]|nr:MAG: tol-pal system protein YbgF [Paracoccaceae bacterium]
MWRAALLAIVLAGPALAQDRAQTLADIRQELLILRGEIDGLRAELNTTGAAQGSGASGPALMRLDTIEMALTALTAKSEALELRINRVVADGTNRLGDIEFRLRELGGGDLASIPPTPPLGGEAPAVTAPATPAPTGGPQLAVSEQADFDRAREVLGQGDFRTAETLFKTFAETYLGGPLTQEAHFLRGEALSQLGETANAARAYLEAFSGAPDGARAPESLLKLGQSLGQLGQGPEACVTLQEVGVRFPGGQPAIEAQAAMVSLGCR